MYLRNRNGIAGCNAIYISDYANVQQCDITGDYCSGITMKNNSKFYRFDLPKSNLSFTNGVQISVPNGCYKMIPKTDFLVPGLQKRKMELYDFLTRRSVIVIVKTNSSGYFLLGRENGIDLDTGSNLVSGRAGVELIGANISLSGAETSRIIQIDPSIAESLISSITYVNMPPTLSGVSSGTSITLSWDFGDTDESIIHIEKSLDSMTGFTEIYQSTLTGRSYVDTNIDEETLYYYRYWFDDGMDKVYSNTFSVWSTYCNFVLSLGTITDQSIVLSWDYGCYQKRNPIEIERSLFPSDYFTLIHTTSSGDTTFTDTGLTFNTTYYYRIRMYLATKYSRYSNTDMGKTSYCSLPLSYANTTDQSTTMNIDYACYTLRNPLDLYKYDFNMSRWEIVNTLSSGTTTYNLTGLTFNTLYMYKVEMNHNNGSRITSNAPQFTTSNCSLSLTQGTNSDTWINLMTSYGCFTLKNSLEIERSLDGTGYTLYYTTTPNCLSYTDTGLTYNTGYWYKMRMLHNNGIYTPYTTPIYSKSNNGLLTLSGSSQTDQSVSLNIGYGGFSTLNPILIDRSLDGTGYTQIYSTSIGATGFTDTGLTFKTLYYYRIRMLHNNGVYTPYTYYSQQTLCYPISLTGSTSGTTIINLNWTLGSWPVAPMDIERSYDGGVFTVIYTTTSGASTWSNTGLTTEHSYDYRVRTHTGTTYSDYSNTVYLDITGVKLYAAKVDGKIYKSVDLGLNWTTMGVAPSGNTLVNSFNVSSDEQTINTLVNYMDKSNFPSRLYRSTNGGSSWTNLYEAMQWGAGMSDNGSGYNYLNYSGTWPNGNCNIVSSQHDDYINSNPPSSYTTNNGASCMSSGGTYEYAWHCYGNTYVYFMKLTGTTWQSSVSYDKSGIDAPGMKCSGNGKYVVTHWPNQKYITYSNDFGLHMSATTTFCQDSPTNGSANVAISNDGSYVYTLGRSGSTSLLCRLTGATFNNNNWTSIPLPTGQTLNNTYASLECSHNGKYVVVVTNNTSVLVSTDYGQSFRLQHNNIGMRSITLNRYYTGV